MEPQRDDYRNYYEKPDMVVNSVLLNSLGTRWPNNLESDDSEDDDMLPTEEYWAIPDDGWTLVEKPHVKSKSRGVRFGNNSVLLNYQRKVIRNTSTLVEVSPNTGGSFSGCQTAV